ncbi:hypothetical protein FVEN_g6436 [Fusarium venenatum]|nr:hypothetical protein FVEN_g6436 [Fusarium venenatum]KAH6991855.1 hypothetical protein EDB82DRAFT_522980 [Fusarium venenatum]
MNSATSPSHNRLTKRQLLSHLFKPKCNHSESGVTSIAKRLSTFTLDNSDSNSDGVYPTLHSPSSVDQNGFDTDIVTAAAKLTLLSNGQYNTVGTSEPSSQKRPPDGSHQPGRNGKKQRPNKSPNNGVGRDTGDGNNQGNSRAPQPDGPRYPQPNSPPSKMWECPLHKRDPDRYPICKSIRMHRGVSDVTTHLQRKHLVKEVKIGPGSNVQPRDVALYCPWCRDQFYGPGADGRLCIHLETCRSINPQATIEQTGVFLPSEFEELREDLRSGSDDVEKWNMIWKKCFPGAGLPASPYRDVGALVPRSQAELSFQSAFDSSSIASAFLTKDDIESIINQALNEIYPGSSSAAAEPQDSVAILPQVQNQPAQPLFHQPGLLIPPQNIERGSTYFTDTDPFHQPHQLDAGHDLAIPNNSLSIGNEASHFAPLMASPLNTRSGVSDHMPSQHYASPSLPVTNQYFTQDEDGWEVFS